MKMQTQTPPEMSVFSEIYFIDDVRDEMSKAKVPKKDNIFIINRDKQQTKK